MDENSTRIEADLDPVIATVLEVLWTAANERPGKPWSLAKLCKRGQLTMSSLRRVLTALKSAGLAEFEVGEDGRGHAVLAPQGEALCAEIFGDGPSRQLH